FGIKAGWIFYTASCLLGFIAVRGGISGWVLYILFFGLYSTIKFYIEKINILVFEYILKLVFYNAVLLVAIIFIKSFLLSSIKTSFPWWIIIVASEILFLIYDYIFTLFIQYYRNKLKRFLKI
ncbi:MAG: hypothetical protein Q8920_13960, partial [Bacillota bacterium]|nr:hypothetical protein [Bacillota bacterium]